MRRYALSVAMLVGAISCDAQGAAAQGAAAPPSFGVPIEIRAVTSQGPAPTAVLVNTATRDIHMFQIAVYRQGRDGSWEFAGSSGQGSVAPWRPGEERRTSVSGWRPDDGTVLVPLFAFFDDGTAVGKPETIEETRASARGFRVALDALKEAFDAFPDPVSADQLPLLIERVALAFARTPYSSQGQGPHHFFAAINELKRLGSPSRPAGLSIEDGVAQARTRLEQTRVVQYGLPLLPKDAPR
ncbi:hypothetical protein TBR22_A22120 [Luteitalea sp. TBR-22]|uniref:hypothetical protein n=1 Tax=Luteitalea sp. TBR-22 TaxID=2802971 RepID=UPI001AF10043|nr:hypothetical protein [Luteitalea sp. TBR-22]BCS32987.1 hypothetical protein TBR22_A22120 [Luteitalea sp. TBR-22]